MNKNDILVDHLKHDYATATLTVREEALCRFAHKLTVTPWKMTQQDMEQLRSAGLEDTDILDAVQVISYFNYINRIADALCVDPEPWMQKRPD